ncbi:hypothetical protein KUTeg_021466 [Tegillarca granosa]|uniref:Uncharacterized protein n=1 Tax=Tegillarca granosa TaxID=220873 RepID=A0ABQ9E3U5_TEGGR|nr:hypothetical protein KUTeg_021466 [Tegillarca granosa]
MISGFAVIEHKLLIQNLVTSESNLNWGIHTASTVNAVRTYDISKGIRRLIKGSDTPLIPRSYLLYDEL